MQISSTISIKEIVFEGFLVNGFPVRVIANVNEVGSSFKHLL